MHHTHTVSRVSGIILLFLSTGAHALGLGEIKVTSMFGQPFYAEIPLQLPGNPTTGETQLSADIPSHSEHAELGLDDPLLVPGLRVEVVASGTASPYIRLTSEQPVSEPALNFLVRTTSTAGLRVREYTVLIDPPGMGKSNGLSVATDTSTPTFETYGNALLDDWQDAFGQDVSLALPTDDMRYEALSMTTTQPTSAASEALVPIAGDLYGPVLGGETLFSIARRVRLTQPDSLDAVVRRLFETNPQAFIDGDMDRLREGTLLELAKAAPAPSPLSEEHISETLAFVKPPPAARPANPVSAAGEAGSKTVQEMEEKVEKAKWILHAEQKENTTLKARLARLEERFAALQEKRAELERKEQQLAEMLESFAQTEAPGRPQVTAVPEVAATVSQGEIAPSVGPASGAAVAPSKKPNRAATPRARTLLPMELDVTWTGLLVVLVAALGFALLWARRKRQAPTPAPAIAHADKGSQDGSEPPEDVHVAFLNDDALTLDELTVDGLIVDEPTVDALTDDMRAEDEPAEDALAANDGKATVIETDAGKAQKLANEVGLDMAYGQYDRAKDKIEEAIALDPRDEHKVVLLTIYAALGEQEETKALTQELLARRESLGDELRVQVEDITRKCA